jgi:hypothetical protein
MKIDKDIFEQIDSDGEDRKELFNIEVTVYEEGISFIVLMKEDEESPSCQIMGSFINGGEMMGSFIDGKKWIVPTVPEDMKHELHTKLTMTIEKSLDFVEEKITEYFYKGRPPSVN